LRACLDERNRDDDVDDERREERALRDVGVAPHADSGAIDGLGVQAAAKRSGKTQDVPLHRHRILLTVSAT
jgi:hypothetical protein